MNPETINLVLSAVDGDRLRPNTTKHEVVGIIGNIAICHAWHKPPFADAPYTGAIMNNGVWKRTSHYSSSADAAILETLGHKYGSGNSRFGMFAARMLELSDPLKTP